MLVTLVPSLNRLNLLNRFIDSVNKTNVLNPGMILVDEADYQANQEAYDALDVKSPANWDVVITGKARSMGDKVRYVWSHLPAETTAVGILNDDHVCITPEWDKLALELLDGTNFISTNDGNWNFGFRVAGLTAFSKALLDHIKIPIFPRNLQHLYIDDVWKQVGEVTGCWVETMKINIEHRHVFRGGEAKDETHEKVYAPTSWEYDAREFRHFMEQDFKVVCEKITELRTSHNEAKAF